MFEARRNGSGRQRGLGLWMTGASKTFKVYRDSRVVFFKMFNSDMYGEAKMVGKNFQSDDVTSLLRDWRILTHSLDPGVVATPFIPAEAGSSP